MKHKLTTALGLLLLIGYFASAQAAPPNVFSYDDTIHLSKNCSLQQNSDEVIVRLDQTGKSGVEYRFNEFYADLVLLASEQNTFQEIVTALAGKYELSNDDCRRKVKHSVNVLSDFGILV